MGFLPSADRSSDDVFTPREPGIQSTVLGVKAGRPAIANGSDVASPGFVRFDTRTKIAVKEREGTKNQFKGCDTFRKKNIGFKIQPFCIKYTHRFWAGIILNLPN